jgi:hypothetical protein
VNVKVKEIELKHEDKQKRIKELKARVVSQIRELDFSDLQQTQKIRIAMGVSDTF